MSNNWPKGWISVALSRFDRLLELSVTQNTSLSIESHKECLINISQSKCPAVIRGLTSSLKKLSNIRIYGERQEYNLYNAQIIVLDLLGKCITVKDLALTEDSVLMQLLLCEICQFLHQSLSDKAVLSQLQTSAVRVLYCISRNNFDVVFARVSARLYELTLSNDELADLSDLFLIQHIYLDLARISKILEAVVKCFKSLRRTFQIALLGILDKALWEWLSSYPPDLNRLYNPTLEGPNSQLEEHQQLSCNAEHLYTLLGNFSEGLKKKSVPYWPLQISLLVLCRDLLNQISTTSAEDTKANKLELLSHLKKALHTQASRHLHDCCIVSLIRLFKAATSIAPASVEDPHPLHRLVRELLPVVQTFLFDNGTKYSKSCDQDILIDCFTCSYRMFPAEDHLAKFCASSTSSLMHKIVWVQALLCISSQPSLPWWPNIDALFIYGSDIRKILHDCTLKMQTQIQSSPKNAQSFREKMNVSLKRSQDDAPSYKDLLHVIMQLVHENPAFFLHNMGNSTQQIHHNVSEFFLTLVLLVDMKNPMSVQITLQCMGALVRLHEPQFVQLWNPESVMTTYWDVSSNVILAICEKVLTQQTLMPADMLSHTTKWLNQILAYRIELLVQNHDKPGVNNKTEVMKRAQFKLELVLMEQLWNSNADIVMQALICFQCLHEEHEIKWSLNDYTMGGLFAEQHEFYHQLSNGGDSGEGVHVKVARRIQRVNKFSKACLEAWEDTHAKWVKIKLKREDAPPDNLVSGKSMARKNVFNRDTTEWTNMTRFLCSLGGVCVKYVEPQSSQQRVSVSSNQSAVASSSSALVMSQENRTMEKSFDQKISSQNQASDFIRSLLNLLGNNNLPDISEITRDLLSGFIHPSLVPTLLHEIKLHMKNILFDESDHVIRNLGNDHFIGNVVSMIEAVFSNCSDDDRTYLGEESVEATLLHVVRYIRNMGSTSIAFNLRINFCNMICKVMERKYDLFFLYEIKFRNKLVEHITDWLMASTIHTVDIDQIVLRELDRQAIVAVGVLMKGLPLHPDEGDGGDVPEAKSQLFLKYFTLFMKLLGECSDKIAESDLLDDESASKDMVALRRLIVVAMSNLLSANIESGLVHSMSLAYHEDIQTRSAFLEVLTKIIQQGVDGFQTLGASVSAERFERLVELVTMMGDNGELPIANALANVVHTNYMDELARVFVTLFDAKHLLYQLLWNMFSKEVEDADSVQTLFRGNSLASKIMTFCFKVYGASYLHNLVEPLVAWSLTPEIANLHFEVDQKRLPQGYDILQCRSNLQRLTERFFTRIMTSTDKFPPQLKSVCHCLYQVVSQRFHESGTGAVASAIFLRFLNPAIATPYEYGLSDRRLPPNLARAFKFMCKIMQNIANYVVFTKEEHMKHFNEFVSARFDVCQQFFMQISTPECASVESSTQSTSFMNDTNVSALHRLLWSDQEKIGHYLAKSRNAKAVGRRPFDKMVTLLAYLGPPEYTRPVLETRMTGQNILPCKFEELMTKRKAADSDEYKLVKGLNIFYQFGRSKMGYPVFYYVARRYVRADIREDILMFYILQALKPYSARKFDVIVDLTHVGGKNRFRGEHLPKWLVLYPQQIYKNLDTVYIYNPNSWFRDYVAYNEATFNEVVGHRSIYFIENLLELKKFIELDHQKVPAATRGLEEDVVVYQNVWRLGQTHCRVHVKVGSKAVQLTMVDKSKLLGFDVCLNDIYYAHEIEAIQVTEANNLFSLKLATNNCVMTFTHPDAAKIVESIRYIRNRWEISQPQQIVSHHKIDAKDVPGTLLNMALLNLGCSKPLVRSNAYNLLCALTTSFSLHLEGRLCESDGLCIPTNNALFIISISNTLAKNENHLTLEFLDECITGFRFCGDKLKNLCLEYMEPWLFNLPAFAASDGVKRNKVKAVIEQLVDLTVCEKEFYLSVQTKIWGNLGKMTSLVDMVLEAFIDTSSKGGMGSIKAEVMADTSVALAAHNMKLVSSKIIKRLCRIIDKTSLMPTPTLEKHKDWEEIAILARYLLMLSFNNNLDVAAHLPYLFHLVSLLLSTGPLSLRASIHGLVVNIIHSLLTCKQIEFREETQQILRLSLTEFCLPKFYLLFGIPHVKSAADIAFKSDSIGNSGCLDNDDVINLSFLDTVVDALLEVMEACMKDLRGSDWLNEWLDLSHKFAFQYNPSLQPRALVVLGCIAKHASLRHVKQIVWIMERALEPQIDPILLEATILCLTRLQLIVCAKPEFHSCLFWIGISVMQLNVKNLFSAGLSLVEQNLHNLDEMGAFAKQPPSIVLMNASVEQHLMDTSVDVSFKSDFHFAFVTHLLKGFRHGDSVVLQRVIRILDFSLELISRHRSCSKYEINLESIAYIAALLPVCDDARRYCVPRRKPDSSNNSAVSAKLDSSNNSAVSAKPDSSNNFAASSKPDASNNSVLSPKPDSSNKSVQSAKAESASNSAVSARATDSSNNSVVSGLSDISSKSAMSAFPDSINNSLLPIKADLSNNSAASEKSCSSAQSAVSSKSDSTNNIDVSEKHVNDLPVALDHSSTENLQIKSEQPDEPPTVVKPPKVAGNSHSAKVKKLCEASHDSDSSASSASHMTSSMTSSRRKHSTDVISNVLLDDEMLDQKYQALLLTQLASQVCHSPNKSDVQIVYEYLAEASSIFPAVFPIVHSLLDQKINSVLNYCEDPVILSHVQIIVHNALLCQDDCMLRSLSFIQDVGFGGMCRFVGPFAKVPSLESTPAMLKLIDSFISTHLMDVPDLTPVQSRLSISSALSAASLDAVHESEDSDEDCDGDADSSRTQPSGGNFRNRAPKLTIKVPNN